ncbi:fungal-specific transcription factor domain-containing protein [Emericellopsis atlantica]|uniref:Fungal-specific transcription factor domain-containing protein n=1 Tax=Emericellopsis atlantica TaxID=2614577 RepID=A0A9P8CRY5_9HYPO|nr:fungal-specific transcription factor domain-containing protein [Emericellopsis atlantica]KAG9256620.1 fungal-specific transcription factor domain-containing protein [Emericellopsis atlantica]
MPSSTAACERCHRRKVRCDKTQPCQPCTRANVACRYTASENALRRQNVVRLEDKVRELTAEKDALQDELRRQRQRQEQQRHDQSSGISPETTSASYAATSSTPQGVEGDVADQVVHLSLIAGGGQHFVGSTSGLLLANLLQSRPQGPSSLDAASAWQPSQSDGHATSSLPPKPLAQDLLTAYCSHDHLCYPFLSTKALHRSLDLVYDTDKPDPVDAFFVDMTLAIGTAQVRKFGWNGIYDAETHYSRAMTRLADVLARDGIARVQALLLVCQYRMGTTSSDTTTSVWHLIGVAARTCLELGLHRASAYVLREEQSDGAAAEEMEVKRRCFWSLVALDRVTSLALGRPFAIQLDDIEVDLPHSDALPTSEVVAAPQSSLTGAEYGTPQWHMATSIFAHIVRYRLICGKIMTSLHRNANKKHNTYSSSNHTDHEAVREALSQELQTWLSQTADLPLVSGAASAPTSSSSSSSTWQQRGQVSSFRSEEWYRLLYHNGMLMVYRPSPCLNDATRNSVTLQHVYTSSRESIHLYATLHRSRVLNYSWITMQTVFMSGLSYIYALRNHLQEEGARLSSEPSIGQVVNDTRACSKVLVAVSERWDMARTCSELFDRLSDAVMADVVEARTSSSHVPPIPTTPQQLSMLAPAGTSRGNGSGLDLGTAMAQQQQQDVSMYGQTAVAPGFVNMTVDSTLRDCYPDLQNLGYDQYHTDAIAQLSQDWFFGIGDPDGRYY